MFLFPLLTVAGLWAQVDLRAANASLQRVIDQKGSVASMMSHFDEEAFRSPFTKGDLCRAADANPRESVKQQIERLLKEMQAETGSRRPGGMMGKKDEVNDGLRVVNDPAGDGFALLAFEGAFLDPDPKVGPWISAKIANLGRDRLRMALLDTKAAPLVLIWQLSAADGQWKIVGIQLVCV